MTITRIRETEILHIAGVPYAVREQEIEQGARGAGDYAGNTITRCILVAKLNDEERPDAASALYHVTQYGDGHVECDCPGFIFRCDRMGTLCKHGRSLIEAGALERSSQYPESLEGSAPEDNPADDEQPTEEEWEQSQPANQPEELRPHDDGAGGGVCVQRSPGTLHAVATAASHSGPKSAPMTPMTPMTARAPEEQPNVPCWCRGCSWSGMRFDCIRAALNPKTGSWIACCPQCKTFQLSYDMDRLGAPSARRLSDCSERT